MKSIALLVVTALTASACGATYLARGDVATPPGYVAAQRESDGKDVLLRRDDVDIIGKRGNVQRLAGVRRHPGRWIAGIVLTSVGAAASIIALGVGLAGASDPCMNLFEYHGPCPASATNMFLVGVTMGPIADVIGGAIGPAILSSGKRSTPEELPPAWMPSLPQPMGPASVSSAR